MSRFKFAVPIVADMLNKRYRRRQFDSADSEFCDLEKTEYKGNPLLSGSGFFAAVSRFKFAVPIVADMLNKRYRRRQFDSADSEFGDLEKPNIKEIHCFRAVDFSLSKNRLIKQYNGMFRQHCLKQFPYRQGINNFVSIPVQLL